ncbi:NYN domain-containing protein [Paucibacter sp. DJ2R-2]|uniref:NYN domain-containing protein n=1 Tax=Paucibacter sp. DJ2R-2 TaxID=2893558 RepID=UPI0021E48481|nr:NYN domain-containing protein [Paucibacter sp. DJ2R-2]MCV2422830.1 NYN domain-containing protein [Paucibacter sp. DJ4R-1]MCV2441029.1 NYN domain-containing protein [Paucibacter sp. DJ2R-2]
MTSFPHPRSEVTKVAVYWDFENLHAVLANAAHGDGAYRENRLKPQPVFVDLNPILEYAASLGDIIINRAYGNWQFFANYRHVLNEAGVDLIQMFPRGQNMKNSADIRMALDALSDVHNHPHLSHVVVISSDSDFISLAQKVKQAGRFIAGVGVAGVSNRFWTASCNEFKFYQNLLAASLAARGPQDEAQPAAALLGGVVPSAEEAEDTEVVGSPSLVEARGALQRALTQLVDRNGENYVSRSALKVFIKRLLPSFDEQALGCSNFSEFLKRFPELVSEIDNVSGGHVARVGQPVGQGVAEPEGESALD